LKVKRIQIHGMRGSGTTWMIFLLRINFDVHVRAGFKTQRATDLCVVSGIEQDYTAAEHAQRNTDCLTIVMKKRVEDWLDSIDNKYRGHLREINTSSGVGGGRSGLVLLPLM